MTARHPTIDEIADHAAGLTAASAEAEIAGHLSTCAECRDVVARLNEVTDLLASAGEEPVRMPADVVGRIDDALASTAVEAAAGVPSLAERRVAKVTEVPGAEHLADDDQRTAPTRRRGPLVLGAAAAVAVFAVGGAVLANGLPGSTSSSDSSAGSAADSQAGGGQSGVGAEDQPETTFQTGGGAHADGAPAKPPKLDEDNVAAFAQDLAAAKPARLPTSASLRSAAARCGHLADPTQVDGRNVLEAYVVFDGDPAVLRVQSSPRRLTVLSCPGPDGVLYSSSY